MAQRAVRKRLASEEFRSLSIFTRIITFIIAALVAVGLACVPSISQSQAIELLDALNPDLSDENEQNANPLPLFGWSLAADGGTLLVGMPKPGMRAAY